MLIRVVYGVGRAGAAVAHFLVLVSLFIPVGMSGHGSAWPLALESVALGLAGLPAVVVVHEAGHFLACRAVGTRVSALYVGTGKSAALRFTLGGVKVFLGWPYAGRVEHDETVLAGRTALITVAGPLANLVAAGALLAAGWPGHWGLIGLAAMMAAMGAANTLPFRGGDGRLSDGARLLGLLGGPFATDGSGLQRAAKHTPPAVRAEAGRLMRDAREGTPQPGRTTRWLAYFGQGELLAQLMAGSIARSLRQEGRIAELSALHARLPSPSGPYARELAWAMQMAAEEVLLLPAPPPELRDLAVNRVDWILATVEFQPGEREAVVHTLALGKLRQGEFAVAEELCWPLLKLSSLLDEHRATVLATIVLARRALGRPYQRALDEALALAPAADLVAEAAATEVATAIG